MTTDAPFDPPIRRRADGSIDHDHYDAHARRLRAHEQRSALWRVAVSLARLVAQLRHGRASARPPTLAREPQAARLGSARAGVRRAPTFWLAALLALGALAAPPGTANAGGADPQPPTVPVSLPLLVAATTGWVAAELGEPVPDALPNVVLVDHSRLRALARSDASLPSPGLGSAPDVRALYRFGSRTIYLPSDWTGATPAQMSILVHEIVHHFQALRGDVHACPAAREELAFTMQARWLASHGDSLESAFGVDPLFLIVATNCLF